jgi:hypothetical protein
MAAKTKVEIDIDITPDMLAAGLQVLVDSGRELPTGADEVLVADMYKAMVRARSRAAAVQVTLPGVLEPGAELVCSAIEVHAKPQRRAGLLPAQSHYG